MMANPNDDAATPRAAFRAFVRRHHPDVGGDPEVFITGLARHRSSIVDSSTMDDGGDAGQHLSRFDAPISFLPKTTRLGLAKQKLTRWREKKKQPPRVR